MNDLKKNGFFIDINRAPPNFAKALVRIHYLSKNKHREFSFETPIYLSGSQHFPEKFRDLKEKHNIMTANEDMLSPNEKEMLFPLEPELRSQNISLVMAQKICKGFMGSYHDHNSVHTEPLILLDIIEKLPQHLNTLSKTSKNISITGLFLGLSTYYDSCSFCRSDLYGFQHFSKDILQLMIDHYKFSNISLAERRHNDTEGMSYGTLVITEGQTRFKEHENKLEEINLVPAESWIKNDNHHIAIVVSQEFIPPPKINESKNPFGSTEEVKKEKVQHVTPPVKKPAKDMKPKKQTPAKYKMTPSKKTQNAKKRNKD